MVKAFNALNAIWNKIETAWRGETMKVTFGEDAISHTRGPPTDAGRLNALTGELRGNLAPW